MGYTVLRDDAKPSRLLYPLQSECIGTRGVSSSVLCAVFGKALNGEVGCGMGQICEEWFQLVFWGACIEVGDEFVGVVRCAVESLM